jgi:hypothetical protein
MLIHGANPLREPEAYRSPCVWRVCSAGNPAAHSWFFLGQGANLLNPPTTLLMPRPGIDLGTLGPGTETGEDDTRGRPSILSRLPTQESNPGLDQGPS